jgi:hypothetical protein
LLTHLYGYNALAAEVAAVALAAAALAAARTAAAILVLQNALRAASAAALTAPALANVLVEALQHLPPPRLPLPRLPRLDPSHPSARSSGLMMLHSSDRGDVPGARRAR